MAASAESEPGIKLLSVVYNEAEFVEDVDRDVSVSSDSSARLSTLHQLRESDVEEFSVSGGAASSGLPLAVPVNSPLEPNMVYTLPFPPRSVFYSKEVIDRAQRLHLHPDQEYMRYDMAKALVNPSSKRKSHGVFSKLKLGSRKQ